MLPFFFLYFLGSSSVCLVCVMSRIFSCITRRNRKQCIYSCSVLFFKTQILKILTHSVRLLSIKWQYQYTFLPTAYMCPALCVIGFVNLCWSDRQTLMSHSINFCFSGFKQRLNIFHVYRPKFYFSCELHLHVLWERERENWNERQG